MTLDKKININYYIYAPFFRCWKGGSFYNGRIPKITRTLSYLLNCKEDEGIVIKRLGLVHLVFFYNRRIPFAIAIVIIAYFLLYVKYFYFIN